MSPETCLTFLLTNSKEQDVNIILNVSVSKACPPETNEPVAVFVIVNWLEDADAIVAFDKLYPEGFTP